MVEPAFTASRTPTYPGRQSKLHASLVIVRAFVDHVVRWTILAADIAPVLTRILITEAATRFCMRLGNWHCIIEISICSSASLHFSSPRQVEGHSRFRNNGPPVPRIVRGGRWLGRYFLLRESTHGGQFPPRQPELRCSRRHGYHSRFCSRRLRQDFE